MNRLHVITAESVQAVNEESIGRGSAALDVRRFRPNIVLKGSGEPLPPFIEDHLLSLRVRNSQTEHRIDITAACVRCIVPNVDPHTAAVSNEPLNLLTELSAQRQPGGPTTFGVYGRSLNAGRIERHAMVALDLNF